MVGDSGQLRNNINAQHQPDSGPNDYPDQAHHLLSSNVIIKLEAKYADLAHNSGYDLNRGSNGLLMPAFYGHQKHPNLQRHRGGHSKAFYGLVHDLVDPIYQVYKGKNPCEDEELKKKILGDLKGAEDEAKANLKSVDWELYSFSKALFDGDYRDEGVGDLSLDRPPFIGKASGKEWLVTKAAGLKRRYQGPDGKEVVKTEFYTGEGYPVPGDPRA
jgi:hypothetical protein